MTELKAQFVELMASINIEHRYYGYIDAQSRRPTELLPSEVIQIVESILTAQVEDVTYDKSEKFFRFTQVTPQYRFVHTVAFSGFGSLELLLSVHAPQGSAGGGLHSLVRSVALWQDKSFNRSPRYPKIPFTDTQELTDALAFSLTLFDEIKSAVIQTKFGQ